MKKNWIYSTILNAKYKERNHISMINNNTNLNKNKVKKYTHLKYEDRVIIEHVLKDNKVNVLNKLFGKKKKTFSNCIKYLAKTLNKSERTIRREIKRATIHQQDSMLYTFI